MWKKHKKYRGSATDLPANWPKKWGKTQKIKRLITFFPQILPFWPVGRPRVVSVCSAVDSDPRAVRWRRYRPPNIDDHGFGQFWQKITNFTPGISVPKFGTDTPNVKFDEKSGKKWQKVTKNDQKVPKIRQKTSKNGKKKFKKPIRHINYQNWQLICLSCSLELIR